MMRQPIQERRRHLCVAEHAVGVEEHFVPLARIGDEHEGATGAELEVCDLNPTVDAANDETFFAPVKLEGFAEFEFEWNKTSAGFGFAASTLPPPDEFGDRPGNTSSVLCQAWPW